MFGLNAATGSFAVRSSISNLLRKLVYCFLFLAFIPAIALATPCEEIIGSGSYQNSSKFTKAPSYVGCYLGQGIGVVLAVPVAAVYIPVQRACGEKDCEKMKSPFEDGGAFVGNMLSHAVGFPFFLLETIFSGGSNSGAAASASSEP